MQKVICRPAMLRDRYDQGDLGGLDDGGDGLLDDAFEEDAVEDGA